MNLTVGETIRDVRQMLKVTQAELGIESGVDHSMIAKLELGQRTLIRETANKLAMALYPRDESSRDGFMISVGFIPDSFMSDRNSLFLMSRIAVGISSGGVDVIEQLMDALRQSYE